MRITYNRWIAVVAALIAVQGAFLAADVTPDEAFLADCQALTAGPHRLAGTDAGRAAFDHVAGRLTAIQPDLVITQTFPVVRMRVERCELVLEDGAVRPLLPMRPNGVILPVTPPEGISGRIVHAGDGEPAQFLDRSVEGAIVVLDYNAGQNWLRAFRLGACAVVFVNTAEAQAWQSHLVDANINLPRFFHEGGRADLPEGAVATLYSHLHWEPGTGRNLFAYFEGRDPVFNQSREEVVVVAAALDSFGEVPLRTPGGRGAANVAGLLKLAGRMAGQRPRRHLLVAFLDAQAQGHQGASRFYRALEPRTAKVTVADRRRSLEAEQAFLDGMWALVNGPDPLGPSAPARRQLLNRLQDRAAQRAFAVADRMTLLRTERAALRRTQGEDGPPAEMQRLAELTGQLDGPLRREKDEWNEVRRALGKDRTDGLAAAVQAKLDLIVADVRESIGLRLEEMDGERVALEADERLQSLLGGKWIALHASLVLGDATPRWGLVVGADSGFRNWNDNAGLYGKVQSVFHRAYQTLVAAGSAPAHFELASADRSLAQTRSLFAAPHLVHSGEIAGLFGIYNLCLATSQESLAREGTPSDTLARLDWQRLNAQVDEIAGMLVEVADLDGSVLSPSASEETLDTAVQPPEAAAVPVPDHDHAHVAVSSQEGLSLRRGVIVNTDYAAGVFAGETVTGPTVMGLLPGSSIPNMRMAGVVVQFTTRRSFSGYQPVKPYGFQDFQMSLTDQNGMYGVGPVPTGWLVRCRGFAARFDRYGRAVEVSDGDSAATARLRLNMFPANAGWLVLPPPWSNRPVVAGGLRLLSARDNGVIPTGKSNLEVGDGVAGWYTDIREPGVKLFDLELAVALNSGPSVPAAGAPVDPLGGGFAMDGTWHGFTGSRRSALDLWRLNESRLGLLQGKNIIDSALAELHGRAEDLLLSTADDPVTLRTEALEASAFMASRPVYTNTRSMVDDLVFAVLILLGLSVPFAFALERVVIGAATIYRQMGWFAGFFLATFVLLFLTHPAFAIANTPVIIFLGFAILVLSLLVISIIVRRFEVELKVLQGMPATVHAASVSKVGTLMAATHMGISTMRRRPLRTALTAVTILLLTFTILSFASFSTQAGIVRLFAAPAPSYSGVLVRQVNWGALGEGIMDVVGGRWQGSGTILPRLWLSPQTENDAGLLVSRADGSRPMSVRGVLGIDPDELRLRPDLREVLGEELEDRILMTPAVARALDVAEGGTVLLKGVVLHVGRLLDGTAVSVLADMDGSSILPVDFTEARSSSPAAPAAEQDTVAINWSSLPVDDVVVVSARTARRLGASLRAFTIYTGTRPQAAALAGDMARMLPLPVAATLDNGVFRHVLGTIVAASGASDLLFPILLGGLVIFGTMLGSVADREREIYTFSALGLAPRHVATLFLAEGMVYSLIGGMGGYLLAQGVLRILNLLAAHGLVQVPEMNMSSTNTIVTILIVMATVLVSAIYPAIKASRSANPGLMRTWQPPAPVGNLIDLVFPFTVSEYDITGVVSFLKEHFDNHTDVGLGRFMARETRILREEDGLLGLRAYLILAPFDLGVSQQFAMRSTPSGIPGIDEVRIRLERVSGQPGDWQRLNRVLLDDLRRQFLIWRALPEATMEVYRHRTLAVLAEAGTHDAAGGGQPRDARGNEVG